MEIVRYWKAIRRRLWVIVFLCVIAAGSALYQDSVQPPRYATTALLVLNNPTVPIGQLPYWDPEATTKSLSETYNYWIHTRAFGTLVSRAMGGDASPEEISSAISTKQVGTTRFYELTATSRTAERAQQIANVAAAVFVSENPQRKAKSDDETTRLLQTELTYFRDREEAYQKQYEDLLTRRPVTLDIEAQIEKTETKLTAARDYVIKILTALGQSGVTDLNGSAAKEDEAAFILEPAALPSAPILARSTQNMMFAIAAAMALGIGIALLLEYLDLAVTIRSPEELEAALGLATLGVVGVINGSDRPERALITVGHPKSPNAEAFRSVDTNMRLSRSGKPLRTILVTSAGPSEGKTLIAANLAVAMAEAGERVALVDADLRRPATHKFFRVANVVGLSNLLVDDTADVTDYMVTTFVENLWLIPSGPIPPRPSVLLSSTRMDDILRQLLERCDTVILDSPPVMAVTDSVVLSSRVDGILLVVMAGRTSRDLLQRSKDTLSNVGAEIIGAVLNRVRSSDLGAYYLYHYYRYARHKNGNEAALDYEDAVPKGFK